MIHCGSRGLGHQTLHRLCTNHDAKFATIGELNSDLELACAPFNSPEGQDYFAAMDGSGKFCWANRHFIGHWRA